MSSARSYGSIQFATPPQMLLLQGALARGSTAARSTEEWFQSEEALNAGARFQGLESGSRRLLPLVYRNTKGTIPQQLSDSLKAVYLEYWAKNQGTFVWLEKLLNSFQANGIPTLLLKGVPLSILHYRDSAVRPFSDVDLLVREEQAPEIIRKLETEGWTSSYLHHELAAGSYVYRHIHAIPFTHPDYGTVDLHWHALHVSSFDGVDGPFWEGSVPLRVKAAETRCLNSSDQLLHTCVHGFQGNVVAPIRWIADAVAVLRTSSVDWRRVVHLGKELRVTMPLMLTLEFLRATFQPDIPSDIVQELAAWRIPRAEQRYFEAIARGERRWLEVVVDHYERHRRIRQGVHPLMRFALLPRDLGSFALYRLRNRADQDSQGL